MNNEPVSRHILVLGCSLALAACAVAQQPPTDALQAADIALANAESDHATEYAPLEMRTAHEKLAAAHADAVQLDDEHFATSRRLADEARADADLALARARLAKADVVNQEMQKSNDALRQEAQRGSGT